MNMKYLSKFKIFVFAVAAMAGFLSCQDFLNRPDPSRYTLADFYKTDAQLLQAANILYSSPWHDFTRGFIGVGDMQAGNHYAGKNAFCMLNHSSTDIEEILSNMSASLWSVNARANTTLENFKQYPSPNVTEEGKNKAKGEILVWKAMAYFYLVRIYGAVPIIHDNSAMAASGKFNEVARIKIDQVYKYIVMCLEEAIRCLPETSEPGRIDRYSAYGLLAKVYLTKSGYGQSGTRNQEDLDKAKQYAEEVVLNSGRVLEPDYASLFDGRSNKNPEGLLSWHWTVQGNVYTAANYFQAELGMKGFDEWNCWGDWTGPSVDLQRAFGEDATKLNTRQNMDKRRKATMMMYGDTYDYFWTDHPTKKDKDGNDVAFPNGFDYTLFRTKIAGEFASSTGANAVKYLVGNNFDHAAKMGQAMPVQMACGNATHILRLADVYLVYAEAILGNNESTSDEKALRAFNAVRTRAGVEGKSAITFDDIMLERRLELAYEGDNWFDFVRLAYYKPEDALDRLKAQERRAWLGLNGGEGTYLFDGVEGVTTGGDGLPTPRINEGEDIGEKTWTVDVFTVPFPDTDVQMNPKMSDSAEPEDFKLEDISFDY